MRMNRKAVAAGLAVGLALIGRETLARRSEQDLHGRVALITGGSRGLGFLLARALIREGCRVAICARDASELERARSQLALEGEVFVHPCDVSHQTEIETLIEAVIEHYGAIDILVNNAGI